MDDLFDKLGDMFRPFKPATNYYAPLYLCDEQVGFYYKIISDDVYIKVDDNSMWITNGPKFSLIILEQYNDGILEKIEEETFDEKRKATRLKLMV